MIYIDVESHCPYSITQPNKLPTSLTYEKYNYRMCAQAVLIYAGERHSLRKILQCCTTSKRLLGRPRRRWEDNINMDVHEVGGGSGDWMELAQDRDRWRALSSTVKNLWVP
jgi:hypothetical protein